MADNIAHRALAALNAECDAVATKCNNGYFRIYTGTMPATADTAPGAGNTLLGSLRVANPASSGAASGGHVDYAAFTDDPSADASGDPAFFIFYESDGTTPVWMGSIGLTSDYAAQINSTPIVAGADLAEVSCRYTANPL